MIRTLHSLCCTLLLLATLVQVGCSNEEPLVVSSLNTNSKTAAFDATGGQRIITVAPFPESETWNVTSPKPEVWFSFTTEGNDIIISAEENFSTTSRYSSLTISSPEQHFAAITIDIVQEAAVAVELSTSATEEYTFDSEGSSYAFNIESNYAWDVTVDSSWVTVECDNNNGRVTLTAEANTTTEQRSATATITAGCGDNCTTTTIRLMQGTHADNPYFKLLGKWEITASKWFYTTNGSLNSLDYSPSATQYYLIFDIEKGEYGKSLYMRNFLYPGTSLEVRYDPATEGFVIPFGWSVYAYEVFLYITLVGNSSFSYAALEVAVTPSAEYTILTPELPAVDGFNYVGFGLWAYDDNGGKEAFGSNMYPTMYPMGDIKFIKSEN